MKIELNKPILSATRVPLKGDGEKDLTIREGLLTELSVYRVTPKATFNLLAAALKVSDESVAEIELSKKELETVKKAIQANEVQTPKGPQQIFSSLIQAQLFVALGLTEEDF